jgi:N4-gp56 family major capsid protein
MSGQSWGVAADGGYMANPELSNELRIAAQPMMRFMQFIRQQPDYGKGKGEQLDYEKITDVETAANVDGLSEYNPMPETKFAVRKASLTAREYGNSVPWTGKLEILARWDPSVPVLRTLRNDMAKTMDRITSRHFKASGVCYTPTGTTGTPTYTWTAGNTDAVGKPTVAATRNALVSDVQNIRDRMADDYRIPPYDGEHYICLASTYFLRGIKNDPYFINAALYGDPDRLFFGEVGMIEGVRFIEVNHRASLAPFPIGSPVCGEAVFFGEDPVVQGVAMAPEIRAKIPTDFGRSKGLAWYFLGGWATPWRYGKNGTNIDAETRVIWFSGSNADLGPPPTY